MPNLEEIVKESLKRTAQRTSRRSAGCPSELELAKYLEGSLPSDKRQNIEKHLSDCSYCLDLLVIAKNILKEEKTAKQSRFTQIANGKWLILTLVSFGFSFVVKRFFLQFLFLALIFGIKWALSGEGSRNLVMIFRSLGHKEAGEESEKRIFARK